jgi:hypothetical protein
VAQARHGRISTEHEDLGHEVVGTRSARQQSPGERASNDLVPYLPLQVQDRSEHSLWPPRPSAAQHRPSGERHRLASDTGARLPSPAGCRLPSRPAATASITLLVKESRAALPDPRASVWELAVETLASVKAGRHEADAVEAVLGAAGHRVSRWREGPAGLTPREVEVLRLVARAASRTRRSPHGWSSHPRPSATTSSTSTPRSTRPTGPARAYSRCSTASCPRRSSPQPSRPAPFSRPASPASSSS